MIQWNQTNLFEMFALNPEAPSFVPAHLQAPQVCEYNEVEYEETKEDDGNDSVEYDSVEYDDEEDDDEEDCYVDYDGQLALMDNVGEWFRIGGVEGRYRYYHVFGDEIDNNKGHFYPRPIRRSLKWVLKWMNSR